MKKTAIIAVMTVFLVMLISCDLFSDKDKSGDTPFWAQNMATGNFYKLSAQLLYTGGKCEIWAEKGSGVTKAMAEGIAQEYDAVIRPRIVDAFSEKNFSYRYNNKEYHFADILDFANWLTGRNNNKLTILLLDIKDGYKEGVNNAYTAGYFYSLDFYERGPHYVDGRTYYSNGRDMIYVDTNPGLKTHSTQTYSTFAHELQHLVNFTTTVRIGRVNSNKELILTDTWVNEGLSAHAEYLYLRGHPDNKFKSLQLPNNTVKMGNNFFVWDNYKLNPNAILDEYATVYLFFHWLYLQLGSQSNIFSEMITSNYPDYRAVTSAAAQINPEGTWESLLRTWLAANYYPGNSVYGYRGDTVLQNKIKIDPIGGSDIQLYPGEGVYSKISGPYSVVSAGNIRYEEIADKTDVVNTLLTFNVNTNKSALPETGSLTGVTPPVTTSSTPTAVNNARSVQQNSPYVIDAQDMLGRDQERFKYPLPR